MGGATPTQIKNAVNILKKRGKRGLMYDEGSPKQVEATKEALRNAGVKVTKGGDRAETMSIQKFNRGGSVSNFKGTY